VRLKFSGATLVAAAAIPAAGAAGHGRPGAAQTADRIEQAHRQTVFVAGVDQVGIGSDLRGMGSYTEGSGAEADFQAIAGALLARGCTGEEPGKVMGGTSSGAGGR
jgi:microsomal dipeptidase-like Zn-dependent dipeptidase